MLAWSLVVPCAASSGKGASNESGGETARQTLNGRAGCVAQAVGAGYRAERGGRQEKQGRIRATGAERRGRHCCASDWTVSATCAGGEPEVEVATRPGGERWGHWGVHESRQAGGPGPVPFQWDSLVVLAQSRSFPVPLLIACVVMQRLSSEGTTPEAALRKLSTGGSGSLGRWNLRRHPKCTKPGFHDSPAKPGFHDSPA
jgi:hypothetical protein